MFIIVFVMNKNDMFCFSLLASLSQENLVTTINPSSPNSDQNQFSPNDIHTL